VRVVLDEFFTLTDEGWSHKRCEAEIATFKDKSIKSADAANKRWNKPSNANAMPTHSGCIADAMPTNNQEPITNNQEPLKESTPAAPKKSRKSSTNPLPDDFEISTAVREWATKTGVEHLERHFESFLVKVRAKGYVYANWDAAFQNAIADDWAKIGAQPQARASPAPQASRHSGFEKINYSEGITDGRID
jgi:hypothetical protein